MKVIADFFVDPLVLPIYIYLAAYGIVWAIAFGLARLFMNEIGIERATTRAWRIAIVIHLLFGTGLAIWICLRAIPRVSEWWHTIFYLLFYVLIVIIDACLLVSIPSQKVKK
ncbi:MAG: hypothetical protein OXI67_13090 [Candidatus Poribacteria bacterium]|nr:hypothetical protein [Candidatus Poribacteria bacterium]